MEVLESKLGISGAVDDEALHVLWRSQLERLHTANVEDRDLLSVPGDAPAVEEVRDAEEDEWELEPAGEDLEDDREREPEADDLEDDEAVDSVHMCI